MRVRPIGFTAATLILILTGPFVTWVFREHLSLKNHPVELATAIFAWCLSFSAVGLWMLKRPALKVWMVLSAVCLGWLLYRLIGSGDPSLYWSILIVSSAVFLMTRTFRAQIESPWFSPKFRDVRRAKRHRIGATESSLIVEGFSKQSQVLDLSELGCFVVSEARLVAGETVDVKLRLDDHDFQVRAQVAWVADEPSGYGLMFTQYGKGSPKELRTTLKSLSKAA